MGAWSYEVLSNDRALDTMWDLVDSKNLKEDIIKLLENGDTDEKVLACEIVDISILFFNILDARLCLKACSPLFLFLVSIPAFFI